MEKEIVEEICKKYGKSERIINSIIKNTLKEGYTFKETVNLIEKFYIEKVCNKVCNRGNIVK